MPELDVSVVITTFNRSALVGRAIRSVMDQDYPGWELIVVDDASIDDTQAVVSNFFPHLRYLKQESNSGVCAARNRALREASRPWVLFLDDDDTLAPDALSRVAAKVSAF